MGSSAVEPPVTAIGHDDPVGHAVIESRDDARAGIFFRRGQVVDVRPVKPATPFVDECCCDRASGGRESAGGVALCWRLKQQVIRHRLVAAGVFVLPGCESEQFEQRFEQFLPDDLFSFKLPAPGGIVQ